MRYWLATVTFDPGLWTVLSIPFFLMLFVGMLIRLYGSGGRQACEEAAKLPFVNDDN